jgi:hypothetical protein
VAVAADEAAAAVVDGRRCGPVAMSPDGKRAAFIRDWNLDARCGDRPENSSPPMALSFGYAYR